MMLNRKDWLRRTNNDEDKWLYARIWDWFEEAQEEDTIKWGHFLTPEQTQKLLQDTKNLPELSRAIILWGGHEEAERRLLGVNPSKEKWSIYNTNVSDEDPLQYIRIHGIGLEHRSVLGSLMGLGIERTYVGDILIHNQGADLIVKASLAEVILENLQQIGRDKIRLSKLNSSFDLCIEEGDRYEESISIASLRLDNLLAGLWHMGRQEAQACIRKEKVSVDGILETKVSKMIEPGQVIRFRGKGKARILALSGVSRKGRQFVKVERFGRSR